MKLAQLRIAEPCAESWDEMRGDQRTRHCRRCDRHVHDLSTLSREEAEGILNTAETHPPCVRFFADKSGAPLTREQLPRWFRWTRRFRWMAAAAAAIGFTMNLAGCITGGVVPDEKEPTALPDAPTTEAAQP